MITDATHLFIEVSGYVEPPVIGRHQFQAVRRRLVVGAAFTGEVATAGFVNKWFGYEDA